MKKLSILLFIVPLLFACVPPKKIVKRADYTAITQAGNQCQNECEVVLSSCGFADGCVELESYCLARCQQFHGGNYTEHYIGMTEPAAALEVRSSKKDTKPEEQKPKRDCYGWQADYAECVKSGGTDHGGK